MAKTKTPPAPQSHLTPEQKANIALGPAFNAAAVVEAYTKSVLGDSDIGALTEELKGKAAKVFDGDLKTLESMLNGQAYALQTMFTNLSRRALTQEYMSNMEIYLKLALKAQSQCRATIETLAAIKNPPVVIARQANIAHGPQQVNNGTAPAQHTPAHAEKPECVRNELLEDQHGEWLDTRTTSTASGINPAVETVGEVHRAKDRSR